jgi:DNA-directed RNA polymerase subunit RPC12/RpoP
VILVDYRCVTCRGRVERLVSTPPPTELPCPACGDRAQRCYRPVSLSGAAGPPSAGGCDRWAPSCREYPDIPGLCHITPSAARAWVARALGDNRRLERELQRQETALRECGGSAGEPVRRDHGHCHARQLDSQSDHPQSARGGDES